jgi:hypothetical protein
VRSRTDPFWAGGTARFGRRSAVEDGEDGMMMLGDAADGDGPGSEATLRERDGRARDSEGKLQHMHGRHNSLVRPRTTFSLLFSFLFLSFSLAASHARRSGFTLVWKLRSLCCASCFALDWIASSHAQPNFPNLRHAPPATEKGLVANLLHTYIAMPSKLLTDRDLHHRHDDDGDTAKLIMRQCR